MYDHLVTTAIYQTAGNLTVIMGGKSEQIAKYFGEKYSLANE